MRSPILNVLSCGVFAALGLLVGAPAAALAAASAQQAGPTPQAGAVRAAIDAGREGAAAVGDDDAGSDSGREAAQRGGRTGRTPAPQPAAGSREPALRANVLFLLGMQWLTARDSFDAILDTHSGLVFGGGGEVALRSGLFVRGDVSRFRKTGERVLVANGQVFRLGQPLTVTLTPIEFTGGYRFFTQRRPAARGGLRLLPYAGGGVGVVRYREESESDRSGETISDSFTSYHVLGGVDVPFSRMFSAGAEIQQRWVPDGLGAGGASQAFGETDLGGTSVRAQFRVHF